METGWKYVRNQLVVILLTIIICLIFLAIGLMIGYSFMGEGDKPTAILSPDKWQTIIEKFTGK